MRAIVAFLCVFTALPVMLSAQAVPVLSLAAWYPLDSNTLDYAGGALHGTPAGTALYGTDRFGNPNHCYEVTGNTNFIWLPAANWVNGNYSVSAWVNVTQTEAYPRLYDFSNGYVIDNVVGKLSHSYNGCPTNENYDSNGNGDACFSPNVLPLNTWTHLVYIVRGNQYEIWMNTILVATTITNYPPQPVYRTLNKLGGSNAPLNDPTYSLIDDFRLYDRAINYEEIVMLYNEGQLSTGINTTVTAGSLSPNPASEFLDVQLSGASADNASYTIYNSVGELVASGSWLAGAAQTAQRIDVAMLERGIYFLQIHCKNSVSTIKWLKI
ncbi:MAG: T9SS type A sorting domain-containing protein [Bacteroidetes bacterium]|nr:T9SS type A sorting domain-containing protein [Bacteroidota bacterium]